MNKNISALLRDLYEIDPALKAQEKELIPIIELLLANNPTREPDEHFVQELRMKLQSRADELIQPRPSLFLFLSPLFAGVVATLIVAVPTTYYIARQTIAPVPPAAESQAKKGVTDLFSYSVSETTPKAFGDIGRFSAPLGMGGGAPPAANDSTATKVDMPISARVMAPNPVRFEYSFSGSLPDLSAKTVQVLSREKSFNATTFDAVRSALHISAIDLASFADSKVESLNLVQDKQFGYNVIMNLREGSISIMQNWEKWPHPEAQCTDEACLKKYAITRDMVPSDDAVIDIANAFVKDHSINLAHYGKPEVDASWKNSGPQPDVAMVPESIRVLYPLLIDDKPVFDSGGNKLGIGIGVSVRLKKVTDMWSISNQSYLRSDYDSVTDAAQIQSYLKTIDTYPGDTAKDIVRVELGEPTLAYSTYFSSEGGKNEELVVPSLVFPVIKAPANQQFYRQTIVVPLAKDLLEKLGKQGQPMPADLVRPMDGAGRG
mgnify:FL=1